MATGRFSLAHHGNAMVTAKSSFTGTKRGVVKGFSHAEGGTKSLTGSKRKGTQKVSNVIISLYIYIDHQLAFGFILTVLATNCHTDLYFVEKKATMLV